MPMPSGLKESEKLPNPMFTPSTKAELGQHDENIHPDQCTLCHRRDLIKVKEIIGPVKAAKVEELALALYTKVPRIANLGY
jgi:phosphoribosylaminoimidazole-succinocarboxamide synthase